MNRDREDTRAAVLAVVAASRRDMADAEIEAAAADEHLRYSIYLDVLSDAPSATWTGIVAAILTDPDSAMRESVLARVIDDLMRTASPVEFLAWVECVRDLLRSSSFLDRRVQEATLLKQIEAGGTVSPDRLLGSSAWLQRLLSEVATSSAVLGVLANGGSTKRIRSSAARRLQSRS